MDHKNLALASESYIDYLESVVFNLNPLEILQAIVWHMDEDDKYNLLLPACSDCDFETLDSSEYCDLTEDESYVDF